MSVFGACRNFAVNQLVIAGTRARIALEQFPERGTDAIAELIAVGAASCAAGCWRTQIEPQLHRFTS